MRRLLTRRRIMLGTVALVILFGFFAARWYAVRYARHEVESRLQALNAGTVEVGDVQLGLRALSVRSVRLRDERSGTDWVDVDRVDAEFSLWDMLFGAQKLENVRVSGVNVQLEVDDQNNLLTPLPALEGVGTLPTETIVLTGASIKVVRDGQRLLSADEIGVDVSATDGIRVTGTVGNALGGAWDVSAGATENAGFKISFGTTSLPLDTASLNGLPVLRDRLRSIGRLQASATMSAEIEYADKDNVQYQLNCVLDSISAELPAAGLTFSQGGARFSVNNEAMQLEQFQATVAGGQFMLQGDLTTAGGRLRAEISALSLLDLPEAFELPVDLSGEFGGQMDMNLEFGGDSITIGGAGRGSIANAILAGTRVDTLALGFQLDRASFVQRVLQQLEGNVHADIAIRDANIPQAIIGFAPTAADLARQIDGRGSLEVHVDCPIENWDNARYYEGTGELEIPLLRVAGVDIRELKSQLDIKQQTVTLEIGGSVGDNGSISGRTAADLDGLADLTAEISGRKIPLSLVGDTLPGIAAELDGEVSGDVSITIPRATIADVGTYRIGGRATAPWIRFADELIQGVSTSFRLENRNIVLETVEGKWKSAQLAGSGRIDVDGKRFESAFSIKDLDVAAATSLLGAAAKLPRTSGTMSLRGAASGGIEPFSIEGYGSGGFQQLAIDELSMPNGQFQWRVDSGKLRLSDFEADFSGGRIVVNATVPFDSSPAKIAGSFESLDSASLFTLPEEARVEVSGPLSGTFDVVTTAGEVDTVKLAFSGPVASAYGAALEGIAGSFSFRDGAVGFKVEGNALGGEISIEGNGKSTNLDLSDLVLDGRIKASNVDLAELEPLLDTPGLGAIRGRGSAELQVTITGTEMKPVGEGTLLFQGLAWNNMLIAREARANLVLSENTLQLRDLSIRMTEGSATGQATLRPPELGGSTFRLALSRVRARRLLALWPDVAKVVDGELDMRIDGRLEQRWNGSALVRLSRGSVGAIKVQRLRAPVSWTYAPAAGRFRLVSSDAGAHVAKGRISMNFDLQFGRRLSLNVAGKVAGVRLRSLLSDFPSARQAIDGALTAKFQLEGRDVRTLKDLAGKYDATLVESQAMLLPVLNDLSAALGLGSLTRRFELSESRGRLASGVIHVDEFFLANTELQLEADGRLWLDGRLDMDVTAHVGQFASDSLLYQLVRSPLMFVQPVGIGLLIRANDFLERRLFFMRVTGSVNNPTIRARGNEFLRQEVILFFLDEATKTLLR